MTDRKTWVISIPPVKCPDDMTGIPNYYIQIWEKYVGKVKPEGGDREDWSQLPRWRASRLGRECGSRDSPLREVVTGAPSIMGG